MQGFGLRLNSGIFSRWEKKYFMLYPNRLDYADSLQVHYLAIVILLQLRIITIFL